MHVIKVFLSLFLLI